MCPSSSLHGALEAGLRLVRCSDGIMYYVGCSPVNEKVSGSPARALNKTCPLVHDAQLWEWWITKGIRLMSGRLLGGCFRNEDDHECLCQRRDYTKGYSSKQSMTIHMLAPLGLRDGYEDSRGGSS